MRPSMRNLLLAGLLVSCAPSLIAPASEGASQSSDLRRLTEEDIRQQIEGHDQNGEQRFLSGDQIRSLVADRWLAREDSFAPGVLQRNEEYFCASGVWGGVGARFPMAGRYTTNGDQLCVLRDGAVQWCRRVLRDDAGRLFTQRVESGRGDQPLIEVRLYTLEREVAC